MRMPSGPKKIFMQWPKKSHTEVMLTKNRH